MALPSSGAISLSQVNVELKKSATARIALGDTAVRALAGRTSGSISMSHLRGKSSEVKYTNSVNRSQVSIYALMGSPKAAGAYVFENTATISAATQGGWALQTGSFPAGSTLRIINRGHIRGGGGNGSPGAPQEGGHALVLNFPATIDNTSGTIWGGGGGGGLDMDGSYRLFAGSGGAGIPAGVRGVFSGYTSGYNGTATAGGASHPGTLTGGGAPGAAGGGGVAGAGTGKRGGYSVQRNGHAVSWAAVGDRRGSVV